MGLEDLSVIASDWLSSSSSAADIYPLINGDGVVGFSDFAVFAKYGF